MNRRGKATILYLCMTDQNIFILWFFQLMTKKRPIHLLKDTRYIHISPCIQIITSMKMINDFHFSINHGSLKVHYNGIITCCFIIV